MNSRLDPYLAYLTRWSHFGLFAVGTVLLLPAGGFAFLMAAFIPNSTLPQEITGDIETLLMTLSCLTGVLAWAALGLLLFKRSDPVWHLCCWPLVGTFGILVIPSMILRLMEDAEPLLLLLAILVVGAYAVGLSMRNFRLARASLKRTQSFNGFVSP